MGDELVVTDHRAGREYRADWPVIINDIEHELMMTNRLLAQILAHLQATNGVRSVVVGPQQPSGTSSAGTINMALPHRQTLRSPEDDGGGGVRGWLRRWWASR